MWIQYAEKMNVLWNGSVSPAYSEELLFGKVNDEYYFFFFLKDDLILESCNICKEDLLIFLFMVW